MSRAYAVLGEVETSVANDQQKLRVNRDQRSSRNQYSIHELVNDMYTVKEYVGHDGVVFAVSWQGNLRPDLQPLLGSYFDQYHELDEARPRMVSRHPVTIRTNKIVVLKGGHMRDIRGIAYIPDRLPANVQVEELQ